MLVIGLVLAVLATVFACGCVEKGSILTKGDEKQVMKLIQKECEYMNKGDWKSLYECYSPGYRDAYPYNAFAEDQNAAIGLIRAFGGKGKFTVEDISVSIKGDIAYATYVIKLGDDVVESKTEGDEDLFVRYNGTWYDMTEAEGPSMFDHNGYNEEDASLLCKAEEMTPEK
jgi:ketosteroid isomerase-like protein